MSSAAAAKIFDINEMSI